MSGRLRQVLTERNAPGSFVDLVIEARNDIRTGAVLARFSAEGRSSVAGTTEQVIARVSEQIVAFVAAHFNG